LASLLAFCGYCAVRFTQKGHKFLLTTIYFVSWDFESDCFDTRICGTEMKL
jgi:hypothetical protein